MIDEFDTYIAEMDSETINIDFDEIDLFGEKLIEEDDVDGLDIDFG